MTAAAAVIWAAAAVMFGFGPAFCAALLLAERRDRKKAALVVGLSSAEWDELTALQDKARAEFESSPIYDRMVCEAMEKAEGWSA